MYGGRTDVITKRWGISVILNRIHRLQNAAVVSLGVAARPCNALRVWTLTLSNCHNGISVILNRIHRLQNAYLW